MLYMFRQRRNLFSFEHTYFAELDGRKAGMALGYGWEAKRRENWRTGSLLLRQMRLGILSKLSPLLKVNGVVGMVGSEEYYISNIAVYPEYRAGGIGTRLLLEAEEEAKSSGAKTVALDVEVENAGAVKLYSRLGFSIVRESSVRLGEGEVFSFYRMCKEL
jgi:ribosomal protein S18 acetylase RimI-like enzyme